METYGYLYGGSQLLAIDDSDNLTFFYFPEPGIRLYDKDMNLIREIKTKNRDMPSLGMNEDYFFYENRADNVLWVIDLHKLDDPNLKGETVLCDGEIRKSKNKRAFPADETGRGSLFAGELF